MRYLLGFFKWFILDVPKRIFIVSKRLIFLVNSRLSVTLNIRLIFTPLFGDYTFVGRIIGITIRIMFIFTGLVSILTLSTMLFILPILWLTSPYFIIRELNPFILVSFPILYLLKLHLNRDIPRKKTSQIDEGNRHLSYRPDVKTTLNLMNNSFKSGLEYLLSLSGTENILKRLELNKPGVKEAILKMNILTPDQVSIEAFNFAKHTECRYVETEHIFLSVIKLMDKRDNFLAVYNLKYSYIEGAVSWVVEERERLSKIYLWQEDYEMIRTGGFGRGLLGRITPFLDSMSEDFTKQAKETDFSRYTIRRDSISRVAEILTGTNENILILGEAGCGKTSLVKGMAAAILEGDEYKSLSNKRIVSLSIGGIIAGAKSGGQLAQKLRQAFDEARGSGDIILFVDEIHGLVTGGDNEDAAGSVLYSILEPELSANKIQFIGATSKQNFRKYIEPNASFSRLFNIVELKEASDKETLDIMKYETREQERRKGVFYTYPALERIIELSKKLIHERVLPDKALIILNRSTTLVGKNGIINVGIIEKEIAEMTHLPIENINEDEAKKLLNISEEMKKMVVGQDFALTQISSALKRARVGIRDEKKPIASFLFVGTTGVGKTQTAKALAKTYFGDEKAMIRLDMGEYQQLDSINRLLGTPDGKTQGILTDQVRSKPFSLILLDEVEKAHSNILLTFLQVLDEGRLTDATGTTIDFTNSLIIATSNVGTRSIQEGYTKNLSQEDIKEKALLDVRNHYAPEFLNRFTGIIVFNPLSKEDIRSISKLLLKKVQDRIEQKGIKIQFTKELIDEISAKGYSPEWGARPMGRLIEDTIELYIANKILENTYKQGDEITIGTECMEHH